MAAPQWVRNAAPLLVPAVLRLLAGTVRIRYLGAEATDPPVGLRPPLIYAFWHQRLLLFAYTHRFSGIAVLISRHADGELIAQVAERLGFTTVRGSATRGGAGALLQLRRLRDRDIAITPDGPRGPRFHVKPGAVYLAAHTGYAVVPATVSYDRAWQFGSWDRFLLPKPGARALVRGAAPLRIPPEAVKQPETYTRQLERLLRDLTEETDRDFERLWRAARAQPPQFLRTRTTLST